MSRKVLELKGYKSLRALNAFNALLLGLKMIPDYMGESYEDFLNRIAAMPPEDQAIMIRKAALFVELQKEEVEAIVGFCTDPNGIPYEAANMGNLDPKELVEVIVAVCSEIGKMKIDFVTPNEKKKSETTQ